jgi:hypothetical protein
MESFTIFLDQSEDEREFSIQNTVLEDAEWTKYDKPFHEFLNLARILQTRWREVSSPPLDSEAPTLAITKASSPASTPYTTPRGTTDISDDADLLSCGNTSERIIA